MPSVTDLLVKLSALALAKHPELNASIDGDSIVQHASINVGIAVDGDRGLSAPVVRDANRKSLFAIAAESAELITKARKGSLSPDAMMGGTFTISNLGMFGIDAFTPILNLPECAILGVGRIVAKPVVIDDETDEIVGHLVTTGTRRIGVFYQNDAYGKSGLDGVTRALETRKLKVEGTATVERNTVDVSRAVAALSKDGPDAIVMISAYSSCAAFVKGMRAAGYTGQFHNVSFVGSTALAEALGSEGVGVAISQVVPFPWAGASLVVREYQRAMTDAGNKEFNFSSLEGFIAAKVFTEGLRRAGRELTRERLIAALETLNRLDIGGMSITFTPTNHNGSRFVDMTMIGSSGRFVH
ncbi:hypothetical protein BH10PSE17_BH10PSE17_18540 [soil metagenome]